MSAYRSSSLPAKRSDVAPSRRNPSPPKSPALDDIFRASRSARPAASVRMPLDDFARQLEDESPAAPQHTASRPAAVRFDYANDGDEQRFDADSFPPDRSARSPRRVKRASIAVGHRRSRLQSDEPDMSTSFVVSQLDALADYQRELVARLVANVRELEAENASLANAQHALRKEVAAERRAREADLVSAAQQHDALRTQLDVLRDDMRVQLESRDLEIAKRDQKIDALSDELERSHADLMQAIQRSEQDREEHQGQLQALQTAIRNLQISVDEKNAQLQIYQAEIKDSRQHGEAEKETMVATVEAAHRRLQQSEEEIASLRSSLSELQDKLDDAELEKQRLELRLRDREAQIEELRDQLDYALAHSFSNRGFAAPGGELAAHRPYQSSFEERPAERPPRKALQEDHSASFTATKVPHVSTVHNFLSVPPAATRPAGRKWR